MANALAKETSPYLLQHRDNPVDWLPWGEQATRCLKNLEAVCAAAGAALRDAVRCTVYLTDLAGAFAEVNEAYGEFFAADPPARVAVGVAALPKGAQVEIDAIVALAS